MTPNQVAAWNLRRLRSGAGMTQQRLAELMSHFGIPWTAFTVSDAERAAKDPDRGRRFSADELALLALLFYVTPSSLLTPPSEAELGLEEPLVILVGTIELARDEYLTDVLLSPSGIAARRSTGQFTESNTWPEEAP